MNKILIIALISLSLALACHPSCVCNSGSNVCKSCVDKNSSMDSNQRSCPCNTGYFTGKLSPFKCAQSITVNDAG